MIDWKQYKVNMQHHTSVQDRNNFISQQQIHDNRHYIKTIAEVLHLCALQDGNFLKILKTHW